MDLKPSCPGTDCERQERPGQTTALTFKGLADMPPILFKPLGKILTRGKNLIKEED